MGWVGPSMGEMVTKWALDGREISTEVRYCTCGTRLSIYNRRYDGLCNPCGDSLPRHTQIERELLGLVDLEADLEPEPELKLKSEPEILGPPVKVIYSTEGLSPYRLIDFVAQVRNLDPGAFLGRGRQDAIVRARRLATYLLREDFRVSCLATAAILKVKERVIIKGYAQGKVAFAADVSFQRDVWKVRALYPGAVQEAMAEQQQ